MRHQPSLFPRFTGMILAMAGAGFAATALQGRVVARDSTGAGVEGVVVTLASSGLKDTTDREGAWGIGNVPVSVGAHQVTARRLAGHLRLEQGRIRLEMGGHDLGGRRFATTPAPGAEAVFAADVPAGRFAAGFVPDTLVYMHKGKTILRDTLSVLTESGIVRTFDTTLNVAITHGYLTDSRDGRVYRTVKLENQLWMAENLAFAADSSFAYAGSRNNLAHYGRLYKWSTAMGLNDSCNRSACVEQVNPVHRGVCPEGWHLPDTTEVKAMIRFVEADPAVGFKNGATALKAESAWISGSATDLFGLRVLPAGYRDHLDKSFLEMGNKTFLWTTHDINASMAWHFNLVSSYTDVEVTTTKDKTQAISVRCLKN